MKYCCYIWYNDRIEVSCICCLFPDDYWLGGLLSPVKASDVPTAAYTCNICGTSYKQRSSLKQHMDVHLNNTKCPICNLTLSRKVDVRRHKKIVHKIFWAVSAELVQYLTKRDWYKTSKLFSLNFPVIISLCLSLPCHLSAVAFMSVWSVFLHLVCKHIHLLSTLPYC